MLKPKPLLTDGELEAVALIADGLTYQEAADALGALTKHAIVERIRDAAAKIPGTLPMRAKVVCWFRGGSRKALGL